MERLKIGFLGVTHLHADTYALAMRNRIPSLELVGIYDRDVAYGREFADRFSTQPFSDPEELLRNVDAVIITSETVGHLGLVKKSVARGKHVLCEKPIATTMRDAVEIAECARRHPGTVFQMCHVVRYHPVANDGEQLLRSGRLGELRALVGVNRVNAGHGVRDWFHDKRLAGGGAVIDHTVHLCDLMRWYTESEVNQVYCDIGRNVNTKIGVEDNFFTTVSFENGVFGHMDGSWSYPRGYPTWGDFVIEMIGTEATALMDVFGQHLEFMGMDAPADKVSWRPYGPDANSIMLEGFAGCISAGTSPLATAEDGVESLRVALASYESSAKHAPVTIQRHSGRQKKR